jgi:hypothetical protein
MPELRHHQPPVSGSFLLEHLIRSARGSHDNVSLEALAPYYLHFHFRRLSLARSFGAGSYIVFSCGKPAFF